jgi:carbamoyltransferase
MVLGRPRQWVMPHAYWGQSFTTDQCRLFLDKMGIAYESFEDREDQLLDVVADALVQGKVMGLFQGRFEWGPRALGNRSILADPRDLAMKEVVNTKIKYREPFRPFAPAVLREYSPEYFDYPDVEKHEAPRYMLIVSPVKAELQDSIAAVSHLGTARLQTVERETNPRYYGIIDRFRQATGVPMVLNTSFNLRGEPIVTTPKDAWNTFFNSNIDLLMMENLLIRRK